jgi:hypothetical protein
MAYKLFEAAQSCWRAVNAPHLVALVRAGARLGNGKLVERSDEPGHEGGGLKFMIHRSWQLLQRGSRILSRTALLAA